VKLRIDLEAYRSNLRALQARIAPAELMAVVKDDAYGHGLDQIVRAARKVGIVSFAVSDLETGIRLREERQLDRERTFAWLIDETDDFAEAIHWDVDLGVSNIGVLDAIAKAGADKPARVHLKIDSGLRRNGASLDQWQDVLSRARHWSDRGRLDVVGIWTHIAETSNADDAAAQAVFEEALAQARASGFTDFQRHFAASGASFDHADFRYDAARVGVYAFGIAPGGEKELAEWDLTAVMSAHATVIDTHNSDSHDVAVLDSGYLHGVPAWQVPSVGSQGSQLPWSGFDVLLNGRRCPIVRVLANETHVLTSRPAKTGDPAVLFGSHLRGEPRLHEWSDAFGTVGEELSVRMGSFNEREFVGE
jgi:alanine racemase